MYGAPLGSNRLRETLNNDVGECAHDASAFICHAFARPMHIKVRCLPPALAPRACLIALCRPPSRRDKQLEHLPLYAQRPARV